MYQSHFYYPIHHENSNQKINLSLLIFSSFNKKANNAVLKQCEDTVSGFDTLPIHPVRGKVFNFEIICKKFTMSDVDIPSKKGWFNLQFF
jgi:hypothetical protein